MKVLAVNQFYSPDTAPTAQLLTELCEYLVREGDEVTVVAGRAAYRTEELLAPQETLNGVRVVRPWSTNFGRGSMSARALDYSSFWLAAVSACAASRKPDVILTLTTPPLIAAGVLEVARARGVPGLVWSQDVYPEVAAALGVLRPNGVAYRLLKRIGRRAMENAHGIVALSEDMLGALVGEGAPASKLTVCPNWANGGVIHYVPMGSAEQRSSALRIAHGWQDRFVLMYSGTLGLAHEVETICEAAARWVSACPRLALVFVGGGARLEQVQRKLANLPNVFFLPHQPKSQLSQTLASADAHLVLLREEVCGLVVPSKFYSALASGRPVFFVGPSNCDLSRDIRKHELGWAGRPGETDELVAAVVHAAEQALWLQQTGLRAREFFEEHFDQPLALARWRGILQAACSS